MRFDYTPLVETGGELLINYGVTYMVGDNLRWNGWEPGKEDSIYTDRRLIPGVLAVGASTMVGGMAGEVLGVAGKGLLNSLVATETIRARTLKPPAATSGPAPAVEEKPIKEKSGLGGWQVV